jgi:SAM-dependent methyltransferase
VPLWIILLAAAGIILLAVFLWWLITATEGVYLGRRAVIWLYDLYATRYDAIKQINPRHEAVYLAQPILDQMPRVRAPLVLDVATGTGRLPLALLAQPTFQGRIVGIDLSRRMIAIAAHKLAGYSSRVSLIHHAAEALPFPNDTFDLVTCLEALEFMENPRAVLRELARVLRPGGLLTITNRRGLYARLMPGKVASNDQLAELLRGDLSLERVEFQGWQVEYQIVRAIKPGHSLPAGPRLLPEIWQCPACGQIEMVDEGDNWRCAACGGRVPVGADGVIEADSSSKKTR